MVSLLANLSLPQHVGQTKYPIWRVLDRAWLNKKKLVQVLESLLFGKWGLALHMGVHGILFLF